MKELSSRKGIVSGEFSLFILLGLLLPTIISVYFYISYASRAWFFQDDFTFIAQYANSIKFSELLNFNNFGRFISRNLYWNQGIHYFSHNAQYFYLFNFFTILTSSILLFKIFSKRIGEFGGIIAGLFYLLLPSTFESYAWLSNSQHLIGHLFVFLFIHVYVNYELNISTIEKIWHIATLCLILMLGFASNIFMSMVLSLPIWLFLTDKNRRETKGYLVVSLFGVLLFSFYYYKLSGSQTGAYSTEYDTKTFIKNLEFYFKNVPLGSLWLISTISGSIYAWFRKDYFISWLFLASFVFFIPFAFFVFQRYPQYGALTYLFFLLATWSLLIRESTSIRCSNSIRYIGVIMILFVFSKSLEPSIRYYTEEPRGSIQKNHIEFLKAFDENNQSIKNYCFRSLEKVKNQTGVKDWDIPGEWWFLGFGEAFSIFVSPQKKYDLIQNAKHCDVVFAFKGSQLELLIAEPPTTRHID